MIRGFSPYVDRCRTYMADKKLHTYTVPMMKPLRIALDIWQKYNTSFCGGVETPSARNCTRS
jgi:3-hydroxypropionyl-CoA synthetase (ADP-forming)